MTGFAAIVLAAAAADPKPTVVVRPPSEGVAGMLPTANTCSARLSLPSYPSVQILKEKLLAAIQIKTFGFV